MRTRTLWTFLWTLLLVSTQLLLAAMIFGAAIYAIGFFGYWFADAYLFE